MICIPCICFRGILYIDSCVIKSGRELQTYRTIWHSECQCGRCLLSASVHCPGGSTGRYVESCTLQTTLLPYSQELWSLQDAKYTYIWSVSIFLLFLPFIKQHSIWPTPCVVFLRSPDRGTLMRSTIVPYHKIFWEPMPIRKVFWRLMENH